MMKSILIIEDDITFGMMLKTWLSKKGFEVSSVSNIARAQKHIEGQGADLILSDLRLPDHDGIDLLKWMNEKGIDIPLIIMTGYADIQSAVQAMKLGARDYVAKPAFPDETEEPFFAEVLAAVCVVGASFACKASDIFLSSSSGFTGLAT